MKLLYVQADAIIPLFKMQLIILILMIKFMLWTIGLIMKKMESIKKDKVIVRCMRAKYLIIGIFVLLASLMIVNLVSSEILISSANVAYDSEIIKLTATELETKSIENGLEVHSIFTNSR